MPKPQKLSPKQKTKQKIKNKSQPEAPGITTKKSYWAVLTVLLAVVSAVFGVTMGLNVTQTAILTVTIVLLIGVIGFIRTSPSNLSLSKRATFIFAGASIIGFCIWAALTLTGTLTGAVNQNGEVFVTVTSFAICLTVGALIGELLGRNQKIQSRLFLNMKN